MREFFKVTPPAEVFAHIKSFARTDTETVSLMETAGRISAADMVADVDLPGFSRSTVDGYAVDASSTFGAGESNPGYLALKGVVDMGVLPGFTIERGEAAYVPTGGMLPEGSDGVVMIEHAEALDDTTLEIRKSVAPGQNVIARGEDFRKGERILQRGRRIRPQETGLLAAFGHGSVPVYRKPRLGIISTGDEVISLDEVPGPGQVRDINTYTLHALAAAAGCVPAVFGVVRDDYDSLLEICGRAVSETDMVLVSGGSSVGTRDLTIQVFSALPRANVLVHGIPISPGKPTILARIQDKPCWGLPGHAASAMVVFSAVVRPFVDHLAGLSERNGPHFGITARLTRNVSSAQGRTDYVRVRLRHEQGEWWAEPVLGKSGLIGTMAEADGLIEIGMNTEGLDRHAEAVVIPF